MGEKFFDDCSAVQRWHTNVSVRATAQETANAGDANAGRAERNATSCNEEAGAHALLRFGQAQRDAHEKLFTMGEAQEIARAKNPTLRQAEAGIKAARAREQQAGLLRIQSWDTPARNPRGETGAANRDFLSNNES